MFMQFRHHEDHPPLRYACEREQSPTPSNCWRHVRFGPAELARGEHCYLKDSFYALYLAAGQPRDMALYLGNLNSQGADFYFNPKATHVARSLVRYYAGEACPRPHEKSLALVMGRISTSKPRKNNRLGLLLVQLWCAVTRDYRFTLPKRGSTDKTNHAGA